MNILVKLYATLWAIILLTAGGLFVTGNFTMFTAVVYGFITFGTTFMGMMCVLPITISHAQPADAHANTTLDHGTLDRVHTVASQIKGMWIADDISLRKAQNH